MLRLGRDDALAGELCRLGRRAGLDAVGVCDAKPFREALVALNQGRAKGWDAGMQFTYRNPCRSTDPARALPGARAMVVGACGYDRREVTPVAARRPKGVVARYAREDHYKILRTALAQVADLLRQRGWRAAVLVDDNALVDRAAAVRAGLGWYGKNTNVLIPGAGSWFVLGSVITDAPLTAALGDTSQSGRRIEPFSAQFDAQKADRSTKFSAATAGAAPANAPAPNAGAPCAAPAPTLTPGPVPDGCGTCRRCIDACPTGALTHDEPGHLDARKCLAWLVQAPGIFPRQYRIALHDRIYGCDDCQEVCPVNKLAARRQPVPAAAEDAQTTVDVLAILAAKDADLLDSLGRWYIPSRDPKYLRRNALIVLGNTGDPTAPEVRSAVEAAITHRDPILRAHGVWAAARLGHRDLVPDDDEDPQVKEEIEAATDVPVTTR